jgi:hypothetical protein
MAMTLLAASGAVCAAFALAPAPPAGATGVAADAEARVNENQRALFCDLFRENMRSTSR